jgi:hypothetical protein
VLVAGRLIHWNGLEKVEEMPHLVAHQSSLLVRGPDSIVCVMFAKRNMELTERRRYSRTLRCRLIGSKVCGCYSVCFSCSPTPTPTCVAIESLGGSMSTNCTENGPPLIQYWLSEVHVC